MNSEERRAKNEERQDLVIAHATADLAARLTEIARSAKAHWEYPREWLEEWRDELVVSEAAIRTDTCCIGRVGDSIVGFYLLAGKGAKRTLEHLWVEPQFIGKGFGKALFTHARQLAVSDGAREIEIVADPNAQGFYERFGAHKIGESVGEVVGERRVLPVLRLELAGRGVTECGVTELSTPE